MKTLNEEKANLRKQLREAYRAISPTERREKSNLLQERILRELAGTEARRIFCYVSYGWEPETGELIRALLRLGKEVAVPRCRDDGTMDAILIRSMEDLKPGMYGIPEPAADRESCSPGSIDLALVPAMALSPEGKRLGKGGGYYDRYLPKLCCPAWGISFFECPVPAEEHDVRMDRCFTV